MKIHTTSGAGQSVEFLKACPSGKSVVAKGHQTPLTPTRNRPCLAPVPGLTIVARLGRHVREACQYFILGYDVGQVGDIVGYIAEHNSVVDAPHQGP